MKKSIYILSFAFLIFAVPTCACLFESERLIFRNFNENDSEALVTILGDKEVMEYCVSYQEVKKKHCQALTETEIKAFLDRTTTSYKENGWGWYAAIKKDDSALIGYCGLRIQELDGKKYPMLAYKFAKKYWQNGYATESALAAKKYINDVLQLTEVIAIVDPSNDKSIHVLEKTGFSFLKQDTFYDFPYNFYMLTFNK